MVCDLDPPDLLGYPNLIAQLYTRAAPLYIFIQVSKKFCLLSKGVASRIKIEYLNLISLDPDEQPDGYEGRPPLYWVVDRFTVQESLNVLKWIHSYSAFDDGILQSISIIISEDGSLDIWKWLLDKFMIGRKLLNKSRLDDIIRSQNIELIEWAWETKKDIFEPNEPRDAVHHSLVCNAATLGKIPMVQWIMQKGLDTWNDAAAYQAAKYGHVELLKWIRGQGYRFTFQMFEVAAANDELEVFKLSILDDSLPMYKICELPIIFGNIPMLEWLKTTAHEIHFKTAEIWTMADIYGNLETKKWAHHNKYKLDNYLPK